MKVLKFFLVVWLGSALIGFIVNPMIGIYILFFPTMPFVEMSSTFAYNARVEKLREFKLEHSIPLRKEQGVIVAKKICNLEHLDKEKNNNVRVNYAKPFCELKKDDKVYFYKDCPDSEFSSISNLSRGYVLVRDDAPIASIKIEVKWMKNPNFDINTYTRDSGIESGWNIPIVEQLH